MQIATATFARKLGQYGFVAAEAALPLARLATDEKFAAGSEFTPIWQALSNVGPGGISVLLEHINDPNINVRRAVVMTLEGYGQAARDAVPLLIARLDANEPDDIDAAIIRALGSIGPFASDALPVLKQISRGDIIHRGYEADAAIQKITHDPVRLQNGSKALPLATPTTTQP